MRLEPVYLVAPKPRPPSMPTRRAFLGMGLAFAVGGAIGSACGYSVGSAKVAEKAGGGPASEDYPLSGNPELDELRRLAVKAPIEELMATAPRFVVLLTRRYREDDLAWSGIGRLAAELVREPQRRTRSLAILVAQAIEEAIPEQRERMQHYARMLREAK